MWTCNGKTKSAHGSTCQEHLTSTTYSSQKTVSTLVTWLHVGEWSRFQSEIVLTLFCSLFFTFVFYKNRTGTVRELTVISRKGKYKYILFLKESTDSDVIMRLVYFFGRISSFTTTGNFSVSPLVFTDFALMYMVLTTQGVTIVIGFFTFWREVSLLTFCNWFWL